MSEIKKIKTRLAQHQIKTNLKTLQTALLSPRSLEMEPFKLPELGTYLQENPYQQVKNKKK